MNVMLPIFPLGQVLMPGRPLPLRIFEPRYRDMLQDLADSSPATAAAPIAPRSFGVLLLSQGMEVNTRWTADPNLEERGALAAIGTVAEIMDLKQAPDGSYELLAVGSRRFRVGTWVPGKAYARAEIEFLDEQDGEIPGGLADELVALYTEHTSLITGRTGQAPMGMAEIPATNDPNLLSYYVASTLPLAQQDRQSLLAEPSAALRMRRARDLLRLEIGLLSRTGTVAVPADALRLPFGPN